MGVEDDMEEQKKYWQQPEWETVSYGNPEMNEWYRGFLKRRDEGTSYEFYDIPDDDIPEAKTGLEDKSSWWNHIRSQELKRLRTVSSCFES